TLRARTPRAHARRTGPPAATGYPTGSQPSAVDSAAVRSDEEKNLHDPKD
ncbi:hypothetical protein GA0115240_14701, partial [Streptomyces sp. DvalAA-14]